MQSNSGNISNDAIAQLAGSPAGMQLIQLLQQTDSAALQNAMQKASTGDLTQAKQLLEPLLASEEAQKLLQQLGGL